MIAGPTGMDLWQLLLTLAVAGSSDAFSGSEGEFCFSIPTFSVFETTLNFVKSKFFGWGQ